MRQLVSVGKAFGDPNRIRVLSALRSGELCVCELADALVTSQKALALRQQLVAKNPEVSQFLSELGVMYQTVASLEDMRGRPSSGRSCSRFEAGIVALAGEWGKVV